MCLFDTNVISEQRKKDRANPGVKKFFQQVIEQGEPGYISVITVGELRRGIELIRVPHYENALDKQIAATALTYGLTLVTRNVDDFKESGVHLLNPFS